MTWDEQYRAGKGLRLWPCEELVRFVSRRYGDSPRKGSVLEVGYGTGANLWFLADAGFSVAGVELSPGARNLAAKHLGSRGIADVQLIDADMLRMPVASGAYDGVVDVMASQHLSREDHSVAYREFRRVLRPGGWLFLHHLGSGTVGYGRIFPGSPPACLLDQQQLVRIIEDAGFTVQSVTSMGRTYGPFRVAQYWSVEAEAT